MDFSSLYDLTPLEIFRIVAPEFSAVSDTDITNKMKFTAIFLDKECYGEAYNVALALLTAHLMAIGGGDGLSTSTARVTSMKEGDLSMGYAALSDDSWLGRSIYGGLLKQMQSAMGMNLVFMTRGPVCGPEDGDWKFQ